MPAAQMENVKILVVEDEPHMQQLLKLNLELDHYQVEVSPCGQTGYDEVLRFSPDLIVLDIMMPNMCGITLCKKLRFENINTPILFLSAKGKAEDRVSALKAGGDDFLAKPFVLDELLLRIQKLAQRMVKHQPRHVDKVEFGNCWINFSSYDAMGVKGLFTLDRKEWIIMKMFTSRPGEIISKEELFRSVWEYYGNTPRTRTIDTFIYNLRQHFCEDPGNPQHILLVKGKGYMFRF